jgi:P-type E1-E2 ATPase
VCACVTDTESGEVYYVQCGNDKLMKRFNVDLAFNKLDMNIEGLEMEGKTVICLAVDSIPRLLISLEELHVAKPEAKALVAYLTEKLKLKVGMITGDNKHSAVKVATHLNIPIEFVTYRAYPNEKKKVVMKY